MPIHFKAVWDKGTVDGATEANVDVVEYVLGSATDGYGSVSPVIDTINREISWDIPLLAAGVGAQQVEFKLPYHSQLYRDTSRLFSNLCLRDFAIRCL